MSPKENAVGDPDATRVHGAGPLTVGDGSYQSVPGFSRAEISLTGVPRKSSLPMILTVVIVLVIAGVAGGYFVLKNRVTTQPGNPGQPNDPVGPVATIKPNLLEISGGTFQMGRNDSLPTEGPAHRVTVNSFAMDKTEVTNSEYAQFVRDTNHTPPEHWGSVKPPVGQELLPVSNISYDDAVKFADWRSKRDGVTYRLPTEEEWEYAARNGDKDNLYPWGNTWQSGRAATQETGIAYAQPVGTYPQGHNRWGVEDLIGNVWEWTSSKASLYPKSPLKLPDVQKDWVVVRGGSYGSQATGERKVSGTMRDWFAPNYKNQVLGFRLVKSGS
jgi:serine/threonine-protein kinase